jgi:hypothetical protein
MTERLHPYEKALREAVRVEKRMVERDRKNGCTCPDPLRAVQPECPLHGLEPDSEFGGRPDEPGKGPDHG